MDTQSTISPEQPSQTDVRDSLPNITRAALEFEDLQWATGLVSEDRCYTAPKYSSEYVPGTLLKVEKITNTSLFTIPPSTALSRIMFQSKTLNGSAVPASGFILWPYSPRTLSDGYPVVVWTHGTSGNNPNCAPSHMKNLWQHFLAPYQLALQGYVVVAPDYAGLGVGKTASGKSVVHEYLAGPSQANDAFYSAQAAQAAFPELSKSFIIMGQSQGGGAAWAAAQRQAIEPVHGYLGAVAVSPVTKVLAQADPILSFLGVGIIPGIASAFPDFDPKDILTADGEQRLDLISRVGGCSPSSITLLMGVQLLKSDWTENPFVQKFQQATINGGKRIQGPLLVLHGELDPGLNVEVTTDAVNETMERFPSSQIEYIRLPGVSHVPALTASQRLWMDWIADRFAGIAPKPYYKGAELVPARPVSSYQAEQNWFVEVATQPYQAPP